jgi:Flp pilus assembly protein TadD
VNSIVQSSAPATAVPDGGEQGKILYEAGQYSEAVKVLQQAVAGYQAQGDSLRQAAGLSNLSLAYQQLGLWSEARSAIAQSLNLLQTEPTVNRSTNRLKVLAQTLNIQGRLQFAQGQAETALATWQQATATYEQVGDEAGQQKPS